MGFLAKRRTKRLMSADVLEVTLSKDEIDAVVVATVDGAAKLKSDLMSAAIGREPRMRVIRTPGGNVIDIVAEMISKKTGDLSRSVSHNQLITIRVAVEPADAGRNRVSIETKNVVTVKGKIFHKKAHESIREGLLERLRARDRNARMIVSRHGAGALQTAGATGDAW